MESNTRAATGLGQESATKKKKAPPQGTAVPGSGGGEKGTHRN